MIAWHDHSIYAIISEYLREQGLPITEPGETDGVALEKIYTALVVQGICIEELISVVEPGVLLTSPRPHLRQLGKEMMALKQSAGTSEQRAANYKQSLINLVRSEVTAKDKGSGI